MQQFGAQAGPRCVPQQDFESNQPQGMPNEFERFEYSEPPQQGNMQQSYQAP